MTTGDPSTLSVEPEEVKALERLAFQVAKECQAGYASLVTDMRATIETWTGNNAGVFTAGWEEFHLGADQVWDALFELADKLGITAETLLAVDESNAAATYTLNL
ncbi:WXG100 family type VII secretion target [Nocardia sp. NPDC057663]|uniref:WXG100 family type VII secretion target n=1 Tax=Nocardia sp. NPDC057663 TaxID=3346201 RepID=UPI00366FDCE4